MAMKTDMTKNMKLYIDATNSEKLTVKVGDEEIIAEARKEKSQMLLPLIVELLNRKNKKLTDLTEIEVNPGPGSFTGIRVGVAIAQALGWSLKIPVNGRKVGKDRPINIKY